MQLSRERNYLLLLKENARKAEADRKGAQETMEGRWGMAMHEPCYNEVSAEFLHGFLSWVCDQRPGKGSQRRPGIEHASSLQIFGN